MPKTSRLATYLSSTLQLPHSNFSLPIGQLYKNDWVVASRARGHYAWQDSHGRLKRPFNRPFVLHDGPPYANGELHVGHALNKIIKDFMCRWEVSQGRRVIFKPGFDCHGLPIELKAISNLGITRFEKNQANYARLRESADQLATSTIAEQTSTFEKWGIMTDFSQSYRTKDGSYEVQQLRVFSAMVQKGLIYRDMKPVWWSIDLETALAEAELTYKDNHTSTAAYVKFPTFPLDGGVKDIDGRVHTDFGIAIWTTTPWTLPANRAVAINKSLDYVIISTKKLGNILVGASKVHQFAEECTEGSYEVVSALIKGAAIIGKVSYRNPFELDTSPGFQVIHANFVSATEGTGLVHCAPGHGLEDFEVCKSVNIKAFAPVDEQGRFTDLAMPRSPAELTGRRVLSDGLEAVLRVLENQSLLLKKMEHTHKYPYEWRQNSPVIVRATPQWFVDLGMIKDEAMRALINVTFLPESGRDRLENFIKDRKSWCISRQRAWGVPIPALYDRDTGEPLLTKESVDHIIKCIEHRGTEAWFKDDLDDPYWVLPKGPPRNQLDDLLGSHSPPNGQIHPHPKCQSQYVRRLETMDVWFDSGSSWTQIQPKSISEALEAMEARQFLPANVYVEGSDQHRGWFQSSLLTSVAWQLSQNGLGLHSPQAPFKKLITHGFVLDEHRQKMSKSVGNVIKPSDVTSGKILREHCFPKSKDDGFYEPGSDGLRLWVATSDFTKDVTIGPVLLYDCHLKMAKLRATVRFLLGNLQDFQYGKHSGSLEYNHFHLIDKIAINNLLEVDGKVTGFFEKYNFAQGVKAIYEWIQSDLSAFYFKGTKDRLYCDPKDGSSRLVAQIVYYHIFEQLLAFLVPICPMLVMEAWDKTPALAKCVTSSPLRRARRQVVDGPITDTRLFERFLHKSIGAMNAAWAQSSVKGGEVQCHAVIDLPEIGDDGGSLYSFLRSNEAEVNKTLAQAFGVSSAELRFVGTKNTPDPYQPREGLAFIYSSNFDIFEGQSEMGDPTELDQSLRDSFKANLWLHPTGFDKCVRCYRHLAESTQAHLHEADLAALRARRSQTLHSPSSSEHNPLCSRCTQAVETLGIPTNPPAALLDQLEPKSDIDEVREKWHIYRYQEAVAQFRDSIRHRQI